MGEVHTLFSLLIGLILLVLAKISNLISKAGTEKVEALGIEYYPPQDANFLDMIYAYSRVGCNSSALLIYLAHKGYIKISETNESKTSSFTIEKIKEYDGTDELEKYYLNQLFNCGKSSNTVNESDLKEVFYKTINKIGINVKQRNRNIWHKSPKASYLIIQYIIIGVSILLTLLGFIIGSFSFFDSLGIVMVFCGFITVSLETIFSKSMVLYTDEGRNLVTKIEGFKEFLTYAEKDRIEMLVHENPQYFYDILPYTYALDITNVWVEKFDTMCTEPPEWYSSDKPYSSKNFNRFLNNGMKKLDNSMTSSPSSSRSHGGRSTGGGRSGRGSGGGGGSSW